MAESIKETADRLFGVSASPVELLPREISLEEMLSYRAQSEQKLKEKRSKRKLSAGKESTEDTEKPCPKCGTINWDQFPDGRKYCLECGAVMEIDGTITGGAIKKEISKQTDGIDKNIVIICEFTCSECSEVIQAQGKNLEAAKKKVIPHKSYDSKSQCNGTFTFSRQVFHNHENTLIGMEHEKRSIITERFQHPKLGKFVCNKCPYLNDCSQAFEDAITCLHISSDLKLKKLIELLERFLLRLN